MKTSLKYGIILAVAVVIWTYLMGFSGLYKNPIGAFLFMLVIPINIVVVVLGLMKTRDEGRGYGGQVAAGLVMGIVAAVLIFLNSLLFTQVVFPSYFEDVLLMQEELLQQMNVPAEQIQQQLEASAAQQTPVRQALYGAIGTIGTSLITALVAAIFIRKKG